ncbi:MAG: GGDEF domain-containing protein [Nitrospiraceae bacterium]|nr:GGDEF domain-containing protein [Nitrospiraceae bacterium]
MMMNRYDLKQRLTWLVKLRWGGILGVLVITHVVRELAVMSFSLIPVYAILGAASLCNFVYAWRLKSSNENLERLALAQITIDQLILAFAVYFSGGCDSPFIYFFIFHVVISGIILPWQYAFAFAFAGSAVLLPAVVLWLKHIGALPHYGIFKNEPMLFADTEVIASYGIAFVSTVLLTAYFVTYLSKRLYERNEEVLRLYTLSERLRSSIRLDEVITIIEDELRGVVGASSSFYMAINKERRVLSLTIDEQERHIPLVDKNSFTDALLRGVPAIIDRRLVTSGYELNVLDLLKIKRCMVFPVMAASIQPCYEYFHCSDNQCAAYKNNKERKCWQLAETHCKGIILANYIDKLALCVSCELFTPIGLFILNLPQEYLPLTDANMDASMRLLDAAGLAVSNALLYEKTMQLSKTDGLTGLKNHREFKESLRSEILRSKRFKRSVGLLLIDIDHFKNYNDANGHPQGDILLKKVAELIKDNFKDTDIVARYGGEEFAVLLLESVDKEQAVAVAERLKGMVDWCKFPKEQTQPNGKLTVSIGVSCFPDDGTTPEEILQAADEALYRAKKEGRNRVVAAARPA